MSFIGKKILNVLNKRERKKGASSILVPFNEAMNIGILYSWEDKKKEELIDSVISQMEGKNIEVLCYNAEKQESQSKFPTVNIADLSSFGKIKSEEAEQFISKPFDFLFHLDFDSNEITDSILSNSKAVCKVGRYIADEESNYDLMIGINNNAGLINFADQMLKYVKALK